MLKELERHNFLFWNVHGPRGKAMYTWRQTWEQGIHKLKNVKYCRQPPAARKGSSRAFSGGAALHTHQFWVWLPELWEVKCLYRNLKINKNKKHVANMPWGVYKQMVDREELTAMNKEQMHKELLQRNNKGK